MTKKEMKRSLRSAVRSATPNVLDRVLAVEDDFAVIEFRETSPPLRPKAGYRMAACMIAAVFLLCMGVLYSVHPQMDSLVSIDVNPGMELSIDAADRVLDYRALNSDAEKVLDGMNLKQKKLDTATDEIVHSLIRHGYLEADSEDNAILISIANNDVSRVEHLQKTVAGSVNTALKENNAKAIVLQQNETLTKDLRTFADDNQISVGKADFVRKLADKDPTLETEDLTNLSIKELTLLVNENQIDISDVVTEYDETKYPDESQSMPEVPISSEPGDIDSSEFEESSSQESTGHHQSRPQDSNVQDGAEREKPGQDVDTESDLQNPESTLPSLPSSGVESIPEEPDEPVSGIPEPELPGPIVPPVLPIEPSTPSEDPPPVKDSGMHSGKTSSVQAANDKLDSETGDDVSRPPLSVSKVQSSSPYSLPEKQDLGLYCEYCGRPSMICKGECSHSRGKRYCKYCGRLQNICKGSCTKNNSLKGSTGSQKSKAPSSNSAPMLPKPPSFVPNQDSHEAAKN